MKPEIQQLLNKIKLKSPAAMQARFEYLKRKQALQKAS